MAAGSLRKALLRSQTRARSAAVGAAVRSVSGSRLGDRFGWHAREAAGCLRRAFLRSPRARSAAGRASCRCARVGSRLGAGWIDEGYATPHALDRRRRKFGVRFGRRAREAAGCLRGAFRRGPSFAGTTSGTVMFMPTPWPTETSSKRTPSISTGLACDGCALPAGLPQLTFDRGHSPEAVRSINVDCFPGTRSPSPAPRPFPHEFRRLSGAPLHSAAGPRAVVAVRRHASLPGR